VIAELWWSEVVIPGNFVRNFCVSGKTTFMAKISKLCYECLHGDIDHVVKFEGRKVCPIKAKTSLMCTSTSVVSLVQKGGSVQLTVYY